MTHYTLTDAEYLAVMNTHAEAWLRIDGPQLLTNAARFLAKR